jgi:hypothetical protein
MEIAENMQLAGFEVLRQAERGVWRGKGAAGYQKIAARRSPQDQQDQKVANG